MNRLYAPACLLILLLLCAGVAGLCRAVDPYRLFSRGDIHTGQDLFYFLRATKAYQLEHGPGDVLFIGTSRIARLRPQVPPDMGEGYNAALPGFTAYEMLHYLRHAALYREPRRVVVFLDYPLFLDVQPREQPGFSGRRLASSPRDLGPLRTLYRHAPDYRPALLSTTAVAASLHTLLGTYRDGISYFSDGTWEMRNPDSRFDRRGRFILIARDYHRQAAESSDDIDLSDLRRLVRWCIARDVDTVFAISPAHLLTLYAYAEAGKLDQYRRWHESVLELLDQEASAAGRRPFPLHGFQTDFDATAEPILAVPANPQFLDAVHFSAAYGDRLRDALLVGPGDAGVLLTPASLPAYLDAVTAKLASFPASEPVVVRELRRAVGAAD